MKNKMRIEALRAIAEFSFSRIAFVTNYDPTRYCVQVTIQPENITTGWIPLLTPFAASGFGIVCPPPIGTAVDVHFQEGSKGAAYASMRFFSQKTPPPAGCPIGACWIIDKAGSFVKMDGAGNIDIQATNITLTPGNSSEVLINGNLTVAPSYTFTAAGIDFNNHRHGGVQAGPSETAGPQYP